MTPLNCINKRDRSCAFWLPPGCSVIMEENGSMIKGHVFDDRPQVPSKLDISQMSGEVNELFPKIRNRNPPNIDASWRINRSLLLSILVVVVLAVAVAVAVLVLVLLLLLLLLLLVLVLVLLLLLLLVLLLLELSSLFRCPCFVVLVRKKTWKTHNLGLFLVLTIQEMRPIPKSA